MKLTDGLFLETFYEVAKDFPEIEANDIIVDDLAMKLVAKPQQFQVVVLTNLQGDIMSDLCAGLVGGLGFAPSANIGENISIFEAVHGTAPDITGKNIANPTALLLSSFMLLRHLGLMDYAARIENALLYTLENGAHTGDFGNKEFPSLSTSDFAKAIISNLGKEPKEGKARISQLKAEFHLPERPLNQKMMVTPRPNSIEKIVGVDIFIESNQNAISFVSHLKKQETDDLKLIMISNRGTQVWPTGSVFTECIDQYRVRFECIDNSETTLSKMLELTEALAKDIFICSVEILRSYNGKKGYSLAQGQ
jgi:isocitrate dehydrogenase